MWDDNIEWVALILLLCPTVLTFIFFLGGRVKNNLALFFLGLIAGALACQARQAPAQELQGHAIPCSTLQSSMLHSLVSV